MRPSSLHQVRQKIKTTLETLRCVKRRRPFVKLKHPFSVVRKLFRYKEGRYKELAENTAQLLSLLF